MSKPVYLIQGDAFFQAQKLTALLATLGKDRGPIETETLRLSEISFAEVLTRVHNKPFFSAAQVFVFQEAVELKTDDLDLLESYLAQPADFSVLIFQWEDIEQDKYRGARSSDSLKKLSALVKKAAGEIQASSAEETRSAVGVFIRQKLKAAGKNVEPAALQKMEREWQDFPSLLDTALENLILASGSHAQITLALVEVFEDGFVRGNRFKLLDALLARNAAETLNGLARLLESGDDDPIALILFFHGQLRLYWQARRLEQRGVGEARIYETLGISPKRAHFFSRQMRIFSIKQLETLLEKLFELDRAIKTGEEEPVSGLEKWALQAAR